LQPAGAREIMSAAALCGNNTTRGGHRGAGSFLGQPGLKDIEASKLFYEKLGFTAFAGNQSQKWLIMKNGAHAIGLFQGMFEKNILTFNPGWSEDAQQLKGFTFESGSSKRMA
jgi:hypothetical protein